MLGLIFLRFPHCFVVRGYGCRSWTSRHISRWRPKVRPQRFVWSQTVHTPNIITDSGCYYHWVVLSVQDHYDVGVHIRKSCSALREKRTRWYASKREPTSRLTASISLSLSKPLLYNTTISTVTSLLKTTVAAVVGYTSPLKSAPGWSWLQGWRVYRGALDFSFVGEH